jgi:hypothetical protein
MMMKHDVPSELQPEQAITKTKGMGVYEIHSLILREVLWCDCHRPIADGFLCVSIDMRRSNINIRYIVTIGSILSETHQDCYSKMH